MMYLGDYTEDATLDFKWSTNDAGGASVTRATNGTISVYKANSTTQTTTGITDTEDFDGLTGIHHCRIDLSSDAFYATANDYTVVLSAATIDGETVNAVLAHFSIENRHQPTGSSPPSAASIADAVWDESLTGHLSAGSAGKALYDSGNVADPWGTALPGAYTTGEAGYIIGTFLDQAISTMNQSPGAGAIPFTYTLTSTTDASPIPDADVWVTSDSEGNTLLASGRTDSNGQITFYLDPGTVYIWSQKPGWNFTNPDVEVVSG